MYDIGVDAPPAQAAVIFKEIGLFQHFEYHGGGTGQQRPAAKRVQPRP
ncbi:hypothetical protein SDC9_107960 [bioreactor metagenome]|uniref:Uncharacterized protein n=1 Tax=bioreactor metagenome TaxID=1076179 RepID=A0A645B7R4_9ZZZZ